MEIIYLSLHCHHQRDSCIKIGSDESHFNVSLIVMGKVTRQCPRATTFEGSKVVLLKICPLFFPAIIIIKGASSEHFDCLDLLIVGSKDIGC